MPTSTVFHRVAIGRLIFEGLMSQDGPYVREAHSRHGVALGVSRIAFVAQQKRVVQMSETCSLMEDAGPRNWWVVKYRDQTRIDISALSEEERAQLSYEFGLHLGQTEGPEPFLASPAFASLLDWARRHPKLAKRYQACRTYIRWYEELNRVGAEG